MIEILQKREGIDMELIIIGIVIIAIGLYVIGTYNALQVTLVRIQASFQEIGNQLKRQANLIPNLVESTKGYLSHEKGIFDALTEARKAVLTATKDTSKLDQATQAISQVLPQLTAILESNPEIRGSEVVNKLMAELRDTADKLVYARRTLIDLTADFNAKIIVFPSNIIANLFGFKPQPGLEAPTTGEHLSVSASETKDIDVKL
jgi:LemA protein